MATARIELPPKLIPVFSGAADVRGAFGGRGSAKTRSFAKMVAARGYMFGMQGIRGQLLCGRQFQNSLEDSSLQECKRAIEDEPWLAAYYEMGEKYIQSRDGRISFAFAGLDRNIGSVKSKGRILLCWVDEGEDVVDYSYTVLIPTLREEGDDWNAELWVTWNPRLEGSPTDTRFRKTKDPRYKIAEINWRDNPKFPAKLERDRQRDLKNRPDEYEHIWNGAYSKIAKAQIFASKFRVDAFEVHQSWDGPYYGLDFGFAQDPTAAVECWISGDCLFVRREGGRVALELDDTTAYLKARLPLIYKHVVRADSARPESISYLKRKGLPRIESVKKGPNSVEDGISFLKSFREIVIHSECEETAREFRLYSYKVDKASGDVLPIVVDAFNHYIDAIRYALEPVMRNSDAVKRFMALT